MKLLKETKEKKLTQKEKTTLWLEFEPCRCPGDYFDNHSMADHINRKKQAMLENDGAY